MLTGRDGRRGATLAVVAVLVAATMAIMALAFDLGIMFRTRAEAQRAADAAALAGASAFMDVRGTSADPIARARATAVAQNNVMVRTAVQPGEVYVERVDIDSQLVTVRVERASVRTYFARIFGVRSNRIGARATAIVQSAGATKCVKPFALPDLWEERSGDDLDGDGAIDVDRGNGNNCRNGECWQYDYAPDNATPDRYQQADPNSYPPGTQDPGTGYGSDLRNGIVDPLSGRTYRRDHGRPVVLKEADPQLTQPGFYYPWRMPNATDYNRGGNDYRDAIAERCAEPQSVFVDSTYYSEPGVMNGPTDQGLQDLIDQDPNARWNPDPNGDGDTSDGRVESPNYPPTTNNPDNWINSPRVIIVPLMDPRYAADARGLTPLRFNNFAMFFVDRGGRPNQPIVLGRFINRFVTGTAEGPTTGPMIQYIRLIR